MLENFAHYNYQYKIADYRHYARLDRINGIKSKLQLNEFDQFEYKLCDDQ